MTKHLTTNNLKFLFKIFLILYDVIPEQSAEENIWTEERWSDRRLEKTT
jgi:hypothetical protein